MQCLTCQVMSWPSLTEKAFAYNLSETPSIHRISNVLAQAYVSEWHMKLSLKCCVCHVLDQCILTWLTSTIVQIEHNSYVKQIYASVNMPSIAHFMHKVLYDNWMADQAHDTSLISPLLCKHKSGLQVMWYSNRYFQNTESLCILSCLNNGVGWGNPTLSAGWKYLYEHTAFPCDSNSYTGDRG